MSTQFAGWDSVCGALAEMRASHGEFGKFFSEVFDQLTVMTAQLAARQEHLVQAAEEQRSQEDTEASTRDAEVQQMWGDVRSELNALRSEIGQQFAQIHAVQAEPADRSAYLELQAQLQEMAQQQAVLDQERKGLEAELEAVRGRAAELADALADQKRLLAQQQAAWAEEFKRIRLLLEVMGGRLNEGIHAINPAKPEPARKAVPAAMAAVGDPVLESVMAQFEILQKDVARRRTAK